jgi:histidinol-phosphate aminotransferase
MSKSRQLAGGRVGYALGHPELIAALNRVKYSFNPYNVNRLSLMAGAAAMEDVAYFRKCCSAIAGNREWVTGELEAMGFEVLPSQTNFVFVRSREISGQELYLRLKEKGILVRWFDADRIRDYVRITIGNLEQMVELMDGIDQILMGL